LARIPESYYLVDDMRNQFEEIREKRRSEETEP